MFFSFHEMLKTCLNFFTDPLNVVFVQIAEELSNKLMMVDGHMLYVDFGFQKLGKVSNKTSKVTIYQKKKEKKC